MRKRIVTRCNPALRIGVYPQMPNNRPAYLLILALCGTRCLAQNLPSNSDARLAVARAAAWQQAADSQESGGKATSTSSPKAPKSDDDSGWEFDLHFGYTITPHSTAG